MAAKNKALVLSISFWLFVAFLLCFLGVAAFGQSEKMPLNSESTTPFNEGWFLVSPAGEQSPITLPIQVDQPVSTPTVITRTIPPHMPGPTVLCFRSAQQTVRVTFDNTLIYAYGGDPAMLPFGFVSGSLWNLVRLPEGSGGGTVTIELASPHSTYTGVVNEVRVGTKAALVFYLLESYFLSLLITIAVFLAGVIMIMVYQLLLRKNDGSREMQYLGWFAVLISIWMFCECRLAQFVTGNTFLPLALAFVSMLVCPIPLFKYICSFREFHYKALFVWLERALYLLVTIVAVLQAFSFVDFVEMMPVIHAVLIAVMAAAVAALLFDWLGNHNRALRGLALGLLLLGTFAVLEIFWLYYSHARNTGDLLRVGVLIFIVGQARVALQKAVKIIRLSRVASVDVLTECMNRTAYIHRLAELEGQQNVTVIMADLNDLKHINDTLGHDMGDDALIRCTRCLSQSFGFRGECYRTGGDEFVLLGVDQSRDQLRKQIAAFKQACARERAQVPYPFVVAYGIAFFDPTRDATVTDTVRRADALMYQQKRMLKRKRSRTCTE